jgi:hypothetical protein
MKNNYKINIDFQIQSVEIKDTIWNYLENRFSL